MGDFERVLRQRQTDSEKRLWQLLRKRRLDGWKFRRQHRVGPFVADFLCFEARLIVELDGSPHRERQRYDQYRDNFLARHGFTVVRFWNGEIDRQPQMVLDRIRRALPPHPGPLPKGEGE